MFTHKNRNIVRYFNTKTVNQEIYENIKSWFGEYTESISSESEEIQMNLDLKKNHSYNTAEIIEDLAKTIDLSESDILIAKTAALLHDIGRFEQLVNFETFSDTEQANHINLGISTLESNSVLDCLNEETKEIILECIRLHHVTELPKTIDENKLVFVQLLRDADRIDILNIVSKYYSDCKTGDNKRLEMELADKPDISKKVFKRIIDEKTADYKDVLTLNDLKLQQMSWIYDFKLKQSFRIVSKNTYLKRIFDTLPKKDSVIDMYRQMKIYLENNL